MSSWIAQDWIGGVGGCSPALNGKRPTWANVGRQALRSPPAAGATDQAEHPRLAWCVVPAVYAARSYLRAISVSLVLIVFQSGVVTSPASSPKVFPRRSPLYHPLVHPRR